jgi:hypothetical protein
MNNSAPKNCAAFNGSDQIMRTFDYELRRHGFAGNQCQIVLELVGKISAEKNSPSSMPAWESSGVRSGKFLPPQKRKSLFAPTKIRPRSVENFSTNRSASSAAN